MACRLVLTLKQRDLDFDYYTVHIGQSHFGFPQRVLQHCRLSLGMCIIRYFPFVYTRNLELTMPAAAKRDCEIRGFLAANGWQPEIGTPYEILSPHVWKGT